MARLGADDASAGIGSPMVRRVLTLTPQSIFEAAVLLEAVLVPTVPGSNGLL